MNNKLIYSSSEIGVNICISDGDTKILEANNYSDFINSKTSLIRLLALFELPVDKINSFIIDENYRIEEILPLSELICFLVIDMRSIYWMELICSFLLSNEVTFQLNMDSVNCLKNRDLTDWLPQRVRHLTRKIINKPLFK
jgi:hypothetical protein